MTLMHKHLFGENIISTEIVLRTFKVENKRSNINIETANYHETIEEFSRGRDEPEDEEIVALNSNMIIYTNISYMIHEPDCPLYSGIDNFDGAR